MTFDPLDFLPGGKEVRKNMEADERRREEEIKRRKDAQAMAKVLEEQSERDRERRDLEQREAKFRENNEENDEEVIYADASENDDDGSSLIHEGNQETGDPDITVSHFYQAVGIAKDGGCK